MVALLQLFHETQGVLIVRKAAKISQAFIERVLSSVPERWMADVVQQRQGFDQVLVEPQCAPNRSGDRRHLHRVRQTCAMVVSHLPCKNLGLVGQPAIRRTVNYSVAIALEGTAIGMFLFLILAPGGIPAVHRVGRQQYFFPLQSRLQTRPYFFFIRFYPLSHRCFPFRPAELSVPGCDGLASQLAATLRV